MENTTPIRLCRLCGTFDCPLPSHRCLSMLEMTDNILSHVATQGTLYSALLVHPVFARAVHYLWQSSQDSYIPLMHTLPTDAYEVKLLGSKLPMGMVADPNMFASPTMVLTRNLCPADFERFAVYASHIRSLNFSPDPKKRKGCPRVFVETMQIIRASMPRPRAPFLPLLRHLGISLDALVNESFEFQVLRGAPLISFNISVMRDAVNAANWEKLADVLSTYCPSLKAWKIVVSGRYDSEMRTQMTPEPVLMGMYCSFGDDLEVFDAPYLGISCGTLAHFARMPRLRKLVFSIDSAQLLLFIRRPRAKEEFIGLEELEIEVANLDDVVALLIRPGMRRLRKLTVVRGGGFGNWSWELDPFFDVVGRKSQSLSLLKLMSSITATLSPLDLPPTSVITDNTLRPLYKCPTMQHLGVELGSVVLIHDAGLAEMAAAWPGLRVLKLVECTTMRVWPNATFGGLLQLVASCQDLEALSLRVDAYHTPVPNTSVVPAASIVVPNLKLKYLNVCTSPVSDAESTAKMIRDAMPEVSRVRCGWQYDGGVGEPDAFLVDDNDNADDGFYGCWCDVSMIVGKEKEVAKKKAEEKVAGSQLGINFSMNCGF